MRRILLSVLALLSLGGPAAATVVVRMDLPALIQRAELIVEGRCLSVGVERDANGLPVTRVRLAVDKGWRGATDGQLLEFTLPGGTLDGRRLVLPGMPQFRVGEELVLFLSATSRHGHRLPVGLGQGRFVVQRDPADGRRSLQRTLEQLELVDAVDGRPVDVATLGKLSYEQLQARLKALPSSTTRAR